MNVKQKIYVYLGLLALLVFVLCLWAYFAYNGKADTGAFIAQLGGLVTILIAAIGALGGFHSGQSGSTASAHVLAAGEAFLSPIGSYEPIKPATAVAGDVAPVPPTPVAPQ